MHALDLLGRPRGAEAERVGPRGESTNGAFLEPHRVADGAHLERVGDHEPGEGQLGAEQADQHGAQRRRLVVERGKPDVRGHHGSDAGPERRGERGQRPREERLAVGVGAGQLEMRVRSRLAVAGKVLRAGGDTDSLHALDEGGDMARDELRLRAEGAHADHRVRRIDDHVRHRRELEVHADRGQLAADRCSHAARQLDVVDRAEGEVAGERAPRRGLEAGHVPALLVRGDQEVRPLRAQRRGQRGDLVRIADVVREQHDSAQPVGDSPPQPVGGRETLEAGKEAGCRGGLEPARAHPRTAPAVSPNAILRCTTTKKITTGKAVSVAPAMSGAHAVPRWVVNVASHSVSVCFSGLCSST